MADLWQVKRKRVREIMDIDLRTGEAAMVTVYELDVGTVASPVYRAELTTVRLKV